MITTTTTLYICKTMDSRYKGENKQIIKQDKKRNNVAEKKRENTNKTINTNKHIQVMIRNTDVIKTGGELSGLEG